MVEYCCQSAAKSRCPVWAQLGTVRLTCDVAYGAKLTSGFFLPFEIVCMTSEVLGRVVTFAGANGDQ
jgi:hypothetical protein